MDIAKINLLTTEGEHITLEGRGTEVDAATAWYQDAQQHSSSPYRATNLHSKDDALDDF